MLNQVLLSGISIHITPPFFFSACVNLWGQQVPCALLHESFRPKPTDKDAPSDDKQLLCNTECREMAVMACMEKFRKEMAETFTPNFERFLNHEFRFEIFSFANPYPLRVLMSLKRLYVVICFFSICRRRLWRTRPSAKHCDLCKSPKYLLISVPPPLLISILYSTE